MVHIIMYMCGCVGLACGCVGLQLINLSKEGRKVDNFLIYGWRDGW